MIDFCLRMIVQSGKFISDKRMIFTSAAHDFCTHCLVQRFLRRLDPENTIGRVQFSLKQEVKLPKDVMMRAGPFAGLANIECC